MSRHELITLGRNFGTFDGWESDTLCYNYLNFEPRNGVIIPAGDLIIDYDKGLVTIEHDGKPIWGPLDIAEVCTFAHRINPEEYR